MARRLRLCPPGVAQHLIQRGNNRQACFLADADYIAYSSWLDEAATLHDVQIHAWVIMTNHIHMLVTPGSTVSMSRMMQQLSRRYTSYFNSAYRRTGTLWEGRYRSCLVDSVNYLLHCYRYIELNPVRAGLVNDPALYKWSSYRFNGFGAESKLITPHQEYLALGATLDERIKNYRALFDLPFDEDRTNEIRIALNSGLALGSERFKTEIEGTTGHRIRKLTAGRPKKSGSV